MFSSASPGSYTVSLKSAVVIVLSVGLPAAFAGPLSARLVHPVHLCDGPKITDISAGLADCIEAASNVTDGQSNTQGAIQWFSNLNPAVTPPPPSDSGFQPPAIPANRILPQYWRAGRCKVTLDWNSYANSVQPVFDTESWKYVPRSEARASLANIGELARSIATDCVGTTQQPRGYRDIALGRSLLRVSMNLVGDPRLALKDPNFLQVVNVAYPQLPTGVPGQPAPPAPDSAATAGALNWIDEYLNYALQYAYPY